MFYVWIGFGLMGKRYMEFLVFAHIVLFAFWVEIHSSDAETEYRLQANYHMERDLRGLGIAFQIVTELF